MRGFKSSVRGLALALSLLSVQTAQALQVSAEQRAACTPDAYKLCAQEIPNEHAVARCMLRKKPSLSPVCRRVVGELEAQYRAEQRASKRQH
jgi:hypothetical protein